MNTSALPVFSATSVENVSLFILISFGFAALSTVYLLKQSLSNSPTTSTRVRKELKEGPQSHSKERTQASARQHSSSTISFVSYLHNMLATVVPRPVPIPDPVIATARSVSATMVQLPIDPTPRIEKPAELPEPAKQPLDAYLVLDVEATCLEGTDFNWPNEIIEWPVCLMQWRDKDADGRAKELVIVEEFRSFVKPTWKPTLSDFCTNLTGITQSDVQMAPAFPQVLENFKAFLVKHELIDNATGKRLKRFTWCSDGPFDVRDFVVKQCFISNVAAPEWLRGDILDVRRLVTYMVALQDKEPTQLRHYRMNEFPRRLSLNITQQLRALGLSGFEGRQHCGIDDARNIARIMQELAIRGVQLLPNTTINFARRWQWMGRRGQVLEEYCKTA